MPMFGQPIADLYHKYAAMINAMPPQAFRRPRKAPELGMPYRGELSLGKTKIGDTTDIVFIGPDGNVLDLKSDRISDNNRQLETYRAAFKMTELQPPDTSVRDAWATFTATRKARARAWRQYRQKLARKAERRGRKH